MQDTEGNIVHILNRLNAIGSVDSTLASVTTELKANINTTLAGLETQLLELKRQ